MAAQVNDIIVALGEQADATEESPASDQSGDLFSNANIQERSDQPSEPTALFNGVPAATVDSNLGVPGTSSGANLTPSDSTLGRKRVSFQTSIDSTKSRSKEEPVDQEVCWIF